MSPREPLRVAIDAQVLPGTAGGVATAIRCLIQGLGKLQDGSDAYTIIVGTQEQRDWLQPYAGPNQQFVLKPSPTTKAAQVGRNGSIAFPGLLKRGLGSLLPVARYIQNLISVRCDHKWPEIPLSDGFYEGLGCDLLHIPTQNFILCALPTIYNPHDLQHLHYPQFWTPSIIAWRETIYPAGCHFAKTVVVGSQWVKDDVILRYRISPEKIQVIPEAPPTELYPAPESDSLTRVRQKYQLDLPYALYPAVTWPHKNHIRLFEALAYLRDKRGVTVCLVCTGSRYPRFWPRIERCIEELNLTSQVKFLGYVPEEDLRVIHRLAQFLIMPTLFEACSLPVFDAWREGLPVACSNASALPDQVLDAGFLFDPEDVESIANAMEKLATDRPLRQHLQSQGWERAKDFDWERTTKAYRATYRRAAGVQLTEEDRWLLSWDWMREPQRKKERARL